MKRVKDACVPRPEVIKSDLEDAIFGADFGHVIDGNAPNVYLDPETFFRNTHPTVPLKKLVNDVFDRLVNPSDTGAVIRLSTGYGGGKTHTLIALWHLAHNINNASLGTELLPAAGRPKKVVVAGIDGDKPGSDVCIKHDDITTHSLWGEIAYQLGGPKNYAKIKDIDSPEKVPDAKTIRDILLTDSPVLILLDEIVLYMLKLNERGYKPLLSFINSLISEIVARKCAVLVITDPSSQTPATSSAVRDLDNTVRLSDLSDPVKDLDGIIARKAADFDPIGDESAQVIVRRLFERVDSGNAEAVSAEYYNAYQRIFAERPDLLPTGVTTKEYAERIVKCYPFHPRLLDTAKDRLGAIQDFQKSRGVLRLFARILRDIWESDVPISLISAGDIDWSSPRIQGDLLNRLNKDTFAAAVDADVIKHAGQLDEQYSTDIHRRVASALLLESIAPEGSMDKRDITLAVLRPDEVGHEPAEALDRLMSVCWHTYKKDSGEKFYFYYEPNPNKLIEETIEQIPIEDARNGVLTLAQEYFRGGVFELIPYPGSPRAVQDTVKLKLVLSDSEEIAKDVCEYEDDSDPDAKRPRRFRNAIFGIAPAQDEMEKAVRDYRRLMAAEKVNKDYKNKKDIRKQIEALLPEIAKRTHIAACRAFTRVVFNGRPSVTLEEKYLIPEDGVQPSQRGQNNLKRFLDDNNLVYKPDDALDTDLLLKKIIPGSTPSLDHPGAYPASAVHERALSSDNVRLMLDGSPVRNSIIKAVKEGKLVVRMPNGDVYDSKGCVTDNDNARRRDENRHLTTLPLNSDVLVAPAEAECVAEWTKVAREDEEDKTKPPEQQQPLPQPTDESATAYDWNNAIEYAEKKPLCYLKLKAKTPDAAKSLVGIAQQFGAQSLALKVSAHGSLKEGGTVRFLAEDVKVNCSINPIEIATKIGRAMQECEEFVVAIEMNFGESGAKNKSECIEKAMNGACSAIDIEARFGKEE